MKIIKLAILSIILLSYVLVLPPSQSAQTVLNGTWKANEDNWNQFRKNKDDDDDWNEKDDKREKVQLLFRHKSKNNNSMNGKGFAYEELQGLTKEQVNGSNIPVKFQITREAGTIECEGKFNDGKGSGDWRFNANKTFSDAMQSRGFNL